MTLQEKILNQLPEKRKEDLIQSQINAAAAILSRSKIKLIRYDLITIPINEVIPSQENEDYENNSSKYDASVFRKVAKGNVEINDLRLDTFRPIAVDKYNMKIIDGNHRHYALKEVGEKNIYIILCDTQNI